MANHKSAIKRNKQNAVRNARNNHIRSTMRTLVKNVREAVAAGDSEAAQAALAKVVPYIDKTSTKGVIHKATASRNHVQLLKFRLKLLIFVGLPLNILLELGNSGFGIDD